MTTSWKLTWCFALLGCLAVFAGDSPTKTQSCTQKISFAKMEATGDQVCSPEDCCPPCPPCCPTECTTNAKTIKAAMKTVTKNAQTQVAKTCSKEIDTTACTAKQKAKATAVPAKVTLTASQNAEEIPTSSEGKSWCPVECPLEAQECAAADCKSAD